MLKETFSSLKVRNFRLYFIGQAISMSGTFMQGVAQAWLVLEISHSGTALGITVALQFLPMLVFGPWGGTIADRFSKFKILVWTKAAFALLALGLGILVVSGQVQLWMILLFASAVGLINIIDSPAYYAFIPEMVPADKLKNAVNLNGAMVNLSRVIGPAIAAVVIATAGMASCFFLNGISYIFVIGVLLLMDRSKLNISQPVDKTEGQMLDGFRYVASKPVLLATAVMIAIIGTLTYEFPVSLALMAKNAFSSNVSSYAALTAAFGLGSAIGGFLHASRKMTGSRTLLISGLAFGASVIAASISPSLFFAVAMMLIVGLCSIWFATHALTTLQLGSTPELRGRVMVIWSMFYLGSTAVGGPIVGYVGQVAGARWSLAIGGIAAIVAVVIGYVILEKNTQLSPEEAR